MKDWRTGWGLRGVALAAGVMVLGVTSWAHAECETDADCAEEGAECVEEFEDCGSGDGTDAGTSSAMPSASSEAERKGSCEPVRVCRVPPPPRPENRCTSEADCPAGFDCTDIGAEHDVCKPAWMTACDAENPCADGFACRRQWPGAGAVHRCVPPSAWGCVEGDPEECPSGYTCRTTVMDLCRGDDSNCEVEPRYIGRGHGGTCRPDRDPCGDEAPCEEGSTCGPDRTQDGAEAEQDIFCEPLPGGPALNPMACEEAWSICVPDVDAEYQVFWGLGRILWPTPEYSGGTDLPGGWTSDGGTGGEPPESGGGTAAGPGPSGDDAPGSSSAGEPAGSPSSPGDSTNGGSGSHVSEGPPPTDGAGGDPDSSDPGSSDPGAEAGDDASSAGGGGGCAAAQPGVPGGSLWGFLVLLGLLARRRMASGRPAF